MASKQRGGPDDHLSSEARIERAKEMFLESLSTFISAHIANAVAANEWVDQRSSPFKPRRHCYLVRTGKLPGFVEGRRVWVRRADLDAYISQHKVRTVDDSADEEREVQRILAERRMKGRCK